MDTLVLLAGGEARRLPGKLEREVNGEPLIVAAFRRFSDGFDVAVSLAAPFPDSILRELNCQLIYDRYEKHGPLGGMLSSCEELACETIGFVAADLPFVDAGIVAALRRAWRDGDEAVLASHGDRIEPLVGWYDRLALLREGRAALERGDLAIHRIVERLHARIVPMPVEAFYNVNTLEDLRALSGG
jgi:molybdopterin-guanine dinucleotide biosynthesis protein A